MVRKQQQARPLDDLDLSIMQLVRMDGRKSFTDLAKELGASEATIRKRFQRLAREGQLKVIAVSRVDPSEIQPSVLINLSVEPAQILSVVDAVCEFEKVHWVLVTSGEVDIVLSCRFNSDKELLDFLTLDLAQIPGVKSTRTLHILRHAKVTFWVQDPDEPWAVHPLLTSSVHDQLSEDGGIDADSVRPRTTTQRSRRVD